MHLGNVTVSGGLTITVNHNGASPQFTLTCISTGGPATTVTWTRDSTTVTEGTETVLDDPVTAQYTHTLTVTGRLLTVTGRLPGLYNCTVENNRPSSDSATLEGKDPKYANHVCLAETNFTVIGGEISVLSASILTSPSSSITMAVGRSLTLTRATPLSSGVTGNYVSKEEQFSTCFCLSFSLILSSIDL